MKAVFASSVKCARLLHENTNIRPQLFELNPKSCTFLAKMSLDPGSISKDCLKMQGTQLPFVSNSATTGHKLQGATKQQLFVHEWNYKKNWPYVVISRATTMEGLYFRNPLSEDLSKYACPPELLEKLDRLRNRCPLMEMSEEEYESLLEEEKNLHTPPRPEQT